MKGAVTVIIGAVAVAGAVAVGVALLGSPRETEASIASIDPRFVGNWDLVSFISFRADGEQVDNDYVARIMYDEFGNMSAVGMPRDLPQRPRNEDGSMQRAGFAYFSTVEEHLDQGYIVHEVIGSPLSPNWVGTDLVRFFEFEENDDILKLSLREGDVPAGRITGTLTWRRIR